MTRLPRTPVARFAEILQRHRDGDARAGHVLDRMAHYLGVGLAGLAVGLAPEVVVVVGDITTAWDRVGPTIEREFRARALPGTRTQIVCSDGAMQPRLRGAVTLVVQQHFGAPNVA